MRRGGTHHAATSGASNQRWGETLSSQPLRAQRGERSEHPRLLRCSLCSRLRVHLDTVVDKWDSRPRLSLVSRAPPPAVRQAGRLSRRLTGEGAGPTTQNNVEMHPAPPSSANGARRSLAPPRVKSRRSAPLNPRSARRTSRPCGRPCSGACCSWECRPPS